MTRKVHTVGVLLIIIAAVLVSDAAWAVTANPLPIKAMQPDGTEITIRLRGDEKYNWIEDLDGYLVKKQSNGFYVYAKVENDRVTPTTWKVGQVDPLTVGLRKDVRPPRSLPPMFSTTPVLTVPPVSDDPLAAPASPAPPQRIVPPITGTVNNLVILCQFNDHDNDEENTYTLDPLYYNVLFNNAGPDPFFAPTGSVKDYFAETSYDMLSFDSLVLVEWIELPEDQAYYTDGQSGGGLYPNNAQRMVEDALNEVEALFADGTINTTDPNLDGYINLDIDEDGFIDAIDFIHSGYGAEFDGDPYKIWSHMWALDFPWVSESTGLMVQPYHTEPALYGDEFYTELLGADITHIGVICHETGHFFGLPDLYDTDGSSNGIGAWGLMANSWGFRENQLYPPHPSAWSKIFLQWVTPTVITEGGAYIAFPAQTDNTTIYRIDNAFFDDPDNPNDPNEYLLIENRQPVGFDEFIPAPGLAIWHIDDSMGSLILNNVNDNEGYPGQPGWPYNGNHYRVALLQADGNYDLERSNAPRAGDSGDLYRPGFVDEITPATVPNTDTYQFGIVNPTNISVFWIDWVGLNDMSFYVWCHKTNRVLNVDQDVIYETIQEAIDAADNGDELIADAGHDYFITDVNYNRLSIDFKGKNITLRSGDVDNPADPTIYPETTRIFGSSNASVVVFQSGEGPDCVLKGFTITRGFADNGGGIECVFSSPTISDCIIQENRARLYGGGIDLWNSQAVVTDCIIRDNQAWNGAGINIDSDSARIQSCQIIGNTSSSVGAGISCYFTSATVTNCVIEQNNAVDAGGAAYLWASDAIIRNCTIIDNTGVLGLGGIYRDAEEPTPPTIINSIIWNNGDDLSNCSATYSCIEDLDVGTGNIHDDPLFVGPYYLSFDGGYNIGQDDNSPCFDAGFGSTTDLANDLAAGLVYKDLTTRTDHALDTDPIDIGYHHYTGPVPQFNLTTSAVNGTIDPDHPAPAGVDYDQYTIVHLEATSDLSPDILGELIWSGTDDDTITDTTNTATMTRDRDVIALFQEIPRYMLTVLIVGTNGSVEISDPDNLENTISARRAIYYRDTVVQLIGVPDTGYRVKAWTGTDNDPSWNANSTITMTETKTVTLEFELDISQTLLVPSVYPTIEQAVSTAKSGDTIIVSPRPSVPYVVQAVDGIDFQGKVITLTSTDPDDPDVIATTIIDAGGTRYNPGRAFHFHTSEDPRSVVTGFTIRNGFTVGALGAHGAISTGIWPPLPDEDPPPPLRARTGQSVMGDGYGGAILIEDCSPTFTNCVIENCVVTGGYGGDGYNGYDIRFDYDPDIDGQSGGHGGTGEGNGYGGAIAILGSSDPDKCAPLLKNITIVDSIARGGCGGNGGNGSLNLDTGRGSWGGDGGWAWGQGYGGSVYCNSSKPTFENCSFSDSHAAYGIRGIGGQIGAGDTWPDPYDEFYEGDDGRIRTDGTMAGGAVYSTDSARPTFKNCSFSENSAYDVTVTLSILTASGVASSLVYDEYTKGGAVFIDQDLDLIMDGCAFTDNLAGAVYVTGGSGTQIDLAGCTFTGNRTYQEFDPTYLHQIISQLWGITSPIPGALFVGPGCDQVNLDACQFSDNYTHFNGGAIYSRSDLNLVGCDFGANMAEGDGGAIELLYGVINPVTLQLDMQNCNFSQNKGKWGGAIHTQRFEAEMVDCTFYNNTAQSGGALFLSEGIVSIDTSGICGNNATGYTGSFHNLDDGLGAGIACMSTITEITNSAIQDNIANGAMSYGGGVLFNGGGHLITGELITHTLKNCLLTGNYATIGGGAVACVSNTDPQIQSCTFSDNAVTSLNGAGGGVFCDWTSTTYISDCIFANCSNHAVYEEPDDADAEIRFCLFADNPNGDLYDAATAQTYTGEAVNLVGLNSDNISGDPLFVNGPFGGYYLDQAQSPAVDAGSVDDPDDLGFGRNYPLSYTTSPDDMPDGGTDSIDTDSLDIGYHYKTIEGAGQFQLTIIAVDDNGTFTVDMAADPDQKYTDFTDDFYAGATIRITAFPNDGYRVADWDGGTVQDGSRMADNFVILDRDKTVRIYFDQPRTLVVGSAGEYTSIQFAIDDAVNGDTVMIQPGFYEPAIDNSYGDIQYLTFNPYNKAITITSINPDDPETVANTILSQFIIEFFETGRDTVFNGLTFTSNYRGTDGETPDGAGNDGEDGINIYGGVMEMRNASPTIMNCRFVDCSARGGDGSAGNSGDQAHALGGDGGWAGKAYGGAVYCAFSSKPLFKNCSFINCAAFGGNGGNGGDGYETTHGGRGGAWVWADSIENSGAFIWWNGWTYGDKYFWEMEGGTTYYGDGYWGYLIYDWDTWTRWFDWDKWSSWDDFNANYVHDPYDAYDKHWKYSGYGGAVYCNYDSSAEFVGCTFIDNYTEGGLCGIGGTNGAGAPRVPGSNLNLDTAGGAVYAANESNLRFEKCQFLGNYSDILTVDIPNDYFVSFGGAVAVEKNCNVEFVNSSMINNYATAGGGLYWADSEVTVADSNFIANEAYLGAGIYTVNSEGLITGTDFLQNQAHVLDQPLPIDLEFGMGAGYYGLSAQVDVVDSTFFNNQATLSGGGIMLTGSLAEEPDIKNCLFVNNQAGTTGGAISLGWNSNPIITNCTLTDNRATGDEQIPDDGLGGGLYCAYNSEAFLEYCIIWDNEADMGRAIAVDTVLGPEEDPVPSTVSVLHSAVLNGQQETAVFVDEDSTLIWDTENVTAVSEELFLTGELGDHYLNQELEDDIGTRIIVDAGPDYASALGMDNYTTHVDHIFDRGKVDMGFHYQLRITPNTCRIADIFLNGIVELDDLAIIAQRWLTTGCTANLWCGNADIDQDSEVGLLDFSTLGMCWLAEDTEPPHPDPAKWEVLPHSEGTGSITMEAKTASDAWWVEIEEEDEFIEYYFECDDPAFSRDWDHEPEYIAIGLTTLKQYAFRVKARDPSGNETQFSVWAYATPGAEQDPPQPDPALWLVPPGVMGPDSIIMSAQIATDASPPVEYYFRYTEPDGIDDGQGDGYDSGWQTQNEFIASDLTTGELYTYRVKARDFWGNETEESIPVSVIIAAWDIIPPTPDPPMWLFFPVRYWHPSGWWHYMAAQPATDVSGVEYFFECNESKYSSGWQAVGGVDPDGFPALPNEYWRYVGGEFVFFSYRIQVRDMAPVPNYTGFSTEEIVQ